MTEIKVPRTMTEIAQDAWSIAEAHGWHTKIDTVEAKLLLIHSEVSEAVEDYRNGDMSVKYRASEGGKPVGFPAELADIIIRVFDLSGVLGIDIEEEVLRKMEFNRGRPFRHGYKKI